MVEYKGQMMEGLMINASAGGANLILSLGKLSERILDTLSTGNGSHLMWQRLTDLR